MRPPRQVQEKAGAPWSTKQFLLSWAWGCKAAALIAQMGRVKD